VEHVGAAAARRVERQRAAQPRVPINCASTDSLAEQNGGAGPVHVNAPAPVAGACAARVRRRMGAPGPAVHEGTGQEGSGGHRTNVDGGGRSDNDGATGAALHSGGKRTGSNCGVVSRWARCPAGVVTLPQVRRSDSPLGACRPGGYFGVAGDPSTSRSGARTFRRITGHMAAAQPSWVRGGAPTMFGETARSMELKFSSPPATPAPTGRRVGARGR
jgi:hypothetical protein